MNLAKDLTVSIFGLASMSSVEKEELQLTQFRETITQTGSARAAVVAAAMEFLSHFLLLNSISGIVYSPSPDPRAATHATEKPGENQGRSKERRVWCICIDRSGSKVGMRAL